MLNNKKILCIIPARAGSKSIVNKNRKLLKGKFLIAWSIECAQQSRYIDEIIVSTDDKIIMNIAKTYNVKVMTRPKRLALDNTPTIDVIMNVICRMKEKFKLIVLCEPTSPLRKVEDIDMALKKLAQFRSAKAIVSVCKHEGTHPEFSFTINKEFVEPYKKEVKHIRRQEIKNIYYPEGTVYISDINYLNEKRTFYHVLTLAYEVPRWKSFEVDDEFDIKIIESIMKWKGDYK